jgi:hypothetical protein
VVGEERALELDADQHVQVVGDLVGGRARHRRTDAVDGGEEAIAIATRERRKGRDRLGPEPAPERGMAAHQVLPQTRLRLVNTVGDLRAAGHAPVRSVQALLVEGVADLVQHREQADLQPPEEEEAWLKECWTRS